MVSEHRPGAGLRLLPDPQVARAWSDHRTELERLAAAALREGCRAVDQLRVRLAADLTGPVTPDAVAGPAERTDSVA
ncbi:hypothetical protein GCM10009613_09530 [Pseudonocardia kongjuensis]|uniref:Uncharacterized protein n=1 Tax=Pseudonocardia kongjuensis TaxID=102227 RepID=A0ABN1XIM8_9PSEU